MSKLFNWAAARLVAAFAFALCFATPLVSWADAITTVNPVTGETETYTYKYVGQSSTWTATDWQNDADPVANPDNAPQTPSSNVWDPILIDGSYTLTAPTLEGWAIRLGLYNGAQVTVPTLNKIQASTTMWFTVDATSKLTLSLPGTGHLGDNQNVNFYVAAPQGLVFNSDFATSQNDTDTFNYYLAGSGSVSFQGISAGTHKIKMADVTLTGTSQVSSKTLVSFTSTTKTFTADAAIKVYGTDGETEVETVNLATVNTTGSTTLTEESAVGTCELVQTSTGIDLYWVDGDPSAIVAKTYQPSISVNFCHGNAPLTTAADVGVGDYAVPGTSWNNMISAGGNNGTFSTPLTTICKIDSTGATSLISGASVAVSGTRGSWHKGNVTAGSDVRNGYIDDNDSNASPQFVVEGIPYYSYKTIIYFASDNNDTKFGYVTVNGVNYKGDLDNTATVAAEVGDIWGVASDTSFTEGGNYLVIPTQVNTDGTLTVVSHRLSGCRAGLAAVQIVEVPKTAGEGELVINVSGPTTYPVDAAAEYNTVYVTGEGTLTFSGEAAITTTTLNLGNGVTVPADSTHISFTTVTGSGTIVYDGVQPSTTVGFNDSTSWFGTVWVKNVGSGGETSNTTTTLGSDTSTAANNTINTWGNANSRVKFTNVRGHVSACNCAWTLVLEDDGDTKAWYNNNGWTASSKDPVFAKLAGDGTFYDKANVGCRQNVTFTDATEFTGTFDVAGKRIGIGGANTADNNQTYRGSIEIASGAVATIASGKTWTSGTSFRVSGTLNVNGTLASEASSAAVSGSGTVVFTGRAPTPSTDAWWKNAAWTGTVQIAGVSNMTGDTSGTKIAFNDYGNEGSIVELNNVTGWLPSNFTCTPKLKVTGTLSLTNGSSGKNNAFKVGTLLGSGTISGSSSAPTAVFNVTDDWSGFTGGIGLNSSKCVVFGETIPDTLAAGKIYISEGAVAEIKTSGNWWATGGIVVDGTLKASGRGKWGGGTPMVINDTGILELTSTGNVDESNSEDYNYGNVTGTGTIKFNGSGYRGFPYTSPADTLSIVAEQAQGIVFRQDNKVIGSLSGTKNLRSDLGDSGKTLTIKQAKDGVWSGIFKGGTDRLATIVVASGDSTTGTLTLAGTQDQNGWTDALTVSGSVNLTGTWQGDTTVSGTFGGTGTLTGNLTFSDGATFKAFAADDEDGLVVSGTVGYPAEGTVTVDVSAIEPETDVALLKAAGLNRDKFVLATGAPEGYALEVVDGVLTLTVPHVTITVPSIANTTVTVKIGDNTIGTSSGDYNVAPDSVVTVTYAAVDGYEISGTTEYTIDTSKSETTFDPAGTTEVKQYVASVTTGELVVKYTSLQAAIDAVAQNKDIVLLANEADGATVSREITFNVVPGEYTYGDIAAGGDYILTTTALEGKTRYSLAPAVIAVTINDVRTPYSMINAPSGIEAANAGPIGTTIEILSGNPADYAEYLPMFDLNVETGVFTKVTDPVAAIYNGVIQVQVYRTLADAVSAAENGQTIKLLANVTLDSTVVVTNSLTLDLNGHDIAATDARALWIKAGAVSIMGEGEISANATENSSFADTSSVIRVGDGAVNANAASLTIGADVTVSSGHCYGITTFGKNTPGISLVVNGTVAVTGTASAISGNGSSGLASANITVNDGAVVSATADAGIYFPGTGTLSIAGGTITGPTAVYVKCGTVNVTGGTLTGTAAKAAYAYNGNGLNATGDALVIDTCGYPGNPATVSVSGGTFTSQNAEAVASYKKGDDAKYADDTMNEAATGFVSGGTFNTAVADTYCANEYEPKDNGDGTYGVRVDKGWIYEDADYPDYTGSWSRDGVALDLVYDSETGKAAIEDGATYTASKPSAGQLVTINLELSFDAANSDDDVPEGAKAAVRLGEGDTEGTYVFQLYTTNELGSAAWLDATASGVTPTIDQDYAFTFVLDMTNKTFTATVGGVALTVDGAETLGFASANASDTVQSIEFTGSGKVTSITGSYEDPEGFVADETIGNVTLTAAQAEWLNGQGNYDALAAKIATMSQTALDNAYLLNLNIAGDFSYEFGVSDLKVDTAAGTATVYVTLTRTGALAENEVAKPIIGTLKLTGTAEIGTAFEEIGSVTFDANADFGDGATTTAVTVDIGENGTGAKFYLPVIE